MEKEIKTLDLSNRLLVLATIFVLINLINFLVPIIFKFNPPISPREFSVSAEGKVFAKPDIATVQIGVKSEGKDTKLIFEENTTKMNSILKEIKSLGIEEKDIQTIRYNLTPDYEFQDGRRIFKGYVLEQEIKVKIRDFSKVGEVLEKATQQGANLISQISFEIEDPEKYLEKAREEAINKAKEKAQKISQKTGIKLEKIINVYEDFRGIPILETGSMKIQSSAIPEIQPGEQEFKVRITLVYQIK
jgi:uncharacterized protein YggE